jgi:bifunctional UDP-N-acetylglucosamine pyrophosphorylase/glucosamine-1-phosphate N-acetyltransferase
MVSHIIALTRQVGARRIAMVVGHLGEQVREALAGEPDLTFVDQKEQRGTGHALMQARDALVDSVGDLLVLYGDTPLLSAETLQRLLTHHRRRGAVATLLTAMVDDPKGYGRVIRQRGAFARIVEERDASPAERAVREINAGVYCFRLSGLFEDLEKVRAENDQGEYYLPDVLPTIVARGGRIEAVQTADPREILGINDRKQLALVDALFRQRILERLMIEGVTILDPGTTYIDAGVGSVQTP